MSEKSLSEQIDDIIKMYDGWKGDAIKRLRAVIIDADPSKLFNYRLNSSTLRAIEIHEGDHIDEAGVKALVAQAAELNANKANRG